MRIFNIGDIVVWNICNIGNSNIGEIVDVLKIESSINKDSVGGHIYKVKCGDEFTFVKEEYIEKVYSQYYETGEE